MTDKPTAATDAEPLAGWPSDVRPISLETLSFLGVDPDGNLYWNGKPVEVRKSLSLTVWQKAGAGLISLSAVVGAMATCVSAYADLAALP